MNQRRHESPIEGSQADSGGILTDQVGWVKQIAYLQAREREDEEPGVLARVAAGCVQHLRVEPDVRAEARARQTPTTTCGTSFLGIR